MRINNTVNTYNTAFGYTVALVEDKAAYLDSLGVTTNSSISSYTYKKHVNINVINGSPSLNEICLVSIETSTYLIRIRNISNGAAYGEILSQDNDISTYLSLENNLITDKINAATLSSGE